MAERVKPETKGDAKEKWDHFIEYCWWVKGISLFQRVWLNLLVLLLTFSPLLPILVMMRSRNTSRQDLTSKFWRSWELPFCMKSMQPKLSSSLISMCASSTGSFTTFLMQASMERKMILMSLNYPGYNNKRGSGSRCDESFPLGAYCTFKFMFSPTAKNVTTVKNLDLIFRKSQELVEGSIILPWKPNSLDLRQPPIVITSINGIQALNLPCKRSRELLEAPWQPNYGNFSHPPSNFIPLRSGIPQFIGSPSITNVSVEWSRIFKGHFELVVEAFGNHDYKGSYFLDQALRLGYKRYKAEDSARTQSGYTSNLEELLRFSIARRIVNEDASSFRMSAMSKS